MKKIIIILLILTLLISAFVLTGCSNSNDNTEKCKVTFLDWDGTIIQIAEIALGRNPQMPLEPKRNDEDDEQFTFVGWDDESTEEIETLTSITNVEENKTLRAVYKSSKFYRVYFIVDGEVYLSYKAGEIFNSPVPEKEGYTFVGWYADEDYKSAIEIHFSFFRYLIEDEYLYAKFTPKSSS